jgi:hypothetical protein
MLILLRCVYTVMVSGILLLAGCYIMADRPQGEAQLDSATLGTQSKSLAGSYGDVGTDGSIKPHPAPSDEMGQKSPSLTGGEIRLGGPEQMPDLRTGTIKTEKPPRPQGSNNRGFSGTGGAGGR